MKGPLRCVARPLSAALGTAVLLLCGGCSTFDHEWKAAAARPAPTNDIAGCWEGSWQSEANGHSGKLRCVVSQRAETEYRAHFRAYFWKIFRYSYVVQLEVSRTDHLYAFEGASDIGWLAGGVYSCQGEATPDRFSATYRSKKDHGTFEMTRPEMHPSPPP